MLELDGFEAGRRIAGVVFAMAVLLKGLGDEGRVALTRAMRDSGDVLTWDLPGPVIDKHSTGGIGDCVSLLLAPALAVCGAFVPMISGRGLGHTGGTLDKLEAIPGFRTAMSEEQLRRQLDEVRCAIVAASGNAVLMEMHGTLQSRIKRLRFVGNEGPVKWAGAVAEHEEMMAALLKRDAAELSRIIGLHMDSTLLRVREVL